MNSIEMAIPCTRAGEANKYVCYKSSSAFSHKKNHTKNSKMNRDFECVKKNAKLTSTNLQHRQ